MISSSIGPCDQLLDILSCQNVDLSMGYRQVKSETNDVRNVVLLAVIPRAYTITSFGSDQCYVLVHIIMEFHLYGHPDDLLLIPSTTFYLLHDHVEH